MPITPDELEQQIRTAFPEAHIEIKDLVGDNDHYALTISSPIFKGKSRVEQHKLVNQALKECLGGTLHALQIRTIATE